MADTKGIETQERAMGETNGMVMNGDHVHNGDEIVGEAVVAQGLYAIEGKKKHWYTYMTTKDFWVILALGYVFSLCQQTASHLTNK